jgi:hypothetical protein
MELEGILKEIRSNLDEVRFEHVEDRSKEFSSLTQSKDNKIVQFKGHDRFEVVYVEGHTKGLLKPIIVTLGHDNTKQSIDSAYERLDDAVKKYRIKQLNEHYEVAEQFLRRILKDNYEEYFPITE